ncbi:hypothetical protein B5M09_004859 [Aphanomyces astaci]|uniref:Uncharacterized protein n=1 Tax=Aphanomyces astaci TaxID=112090 RepID=A0A425D232_APHAT|nr:hypothetical protein B5M09_004859 [Aphanomyces astaci]
MVQRFDAQVATWIPNPVVRAELVGVVHSPSFVGFVGNNNVFTPSELPFEQRPLIGVATPEASMWDFHKSIIFPYHLAMASVLYSTFVAFTTVIAKVPDNTQVNVAVLMLALLLPLCLAVVVIVLLHEYPCRVYLYYRLWEHKVAVNFKARSFDHPATQAKVGFMAVVVLFYCFFGYAEYHPTYKYYLVVIQSFGTIGWVLYSNLFVDTALVPINSALRHFQVSQAKNANDKGPTASPSQQLAHAMVNVQFVPEANVKYDILALLRFTSNIRAAKKAVAKDDPRQALLDADLFWLQMLATSVGHLGHTWSTVPGRVAPWDREMYAFDFISSSLFRDDIWDGVGAFGITQPNKKRQATSLLLSMKLSSLVVVAVEIAGFVSLTYSVQ